ncbi:MAG: hypothetical protein PHR37_01700 [Eubacteriales bacterium]|nr:hypothetical protein [Eubacteriales bacterium]
MLNYKKPAFWIIVVLVVACIVLAVYFLTNSTFNKPALKAGFYVNEKDEMGAYIYFDTDHLAWRTGSGIAISYAVGGKYQLEGKQIVARAEDDTVEIVLKMVSDSEIVVESVREELSGVSFWISESDRLIFRYGED